MYKYTKIKGLDSREIKSLPESKKSDEHSMSFQSSLKMKQWKFTTPDQLATPSAPLIEVLLIKIVLFFDHWGVHLFQSNQHFQAIEFMDQLPVPEKLNLLHKSFLSFLRENMHGSSHAYPQFSWSPRRSTLRPWLLFCGIKTKKKNVLQIVSLQSRLTRNLVMRFVRAICIITQ